MFFFFLSAFPADMRYNFDKINTLNQGTPYDYNSVMQYERYGHSIYNLHCHVYFVISASDDFHCFF